MCARRCARQSCEGRKPCHARDASMGPIFGHFQRPRARHCYLQCFNAQLDPISVCRLSKKFGSSSLLFVFSRLRYSSAYCTIESRRATGTSIRQDSLLSSFAVRWKLIVLHNAPAWAQESATRVPKWKDLGPLRLPCPRTAPGAPQRFVQNTPVLHAGRILRLGDRRADGDVRRVGGSARDERSDNSCWGKLLVLAPHESEESCL